MTASRTAPPPLLHVGAGEPVLLIHPFLMTHEVWAEVARLLAVDHEVLAVTLPGHWGGPRASWTHMSASDMADALELVMDQHGWDTCHVVGNSLGGWVAFELEQRGRARTVTAIAPAGGWTSLSVPAVRLGVTFLALAPVLALAKPFVGWAAKTRRIQKAAMSVVAADPAAVPPEVAERAMWAAVRSNSILQVLWGAAWDNGLKGIKQTKTPTQLLLCDKDMVIPWRSYGRKFLRELPPETERCIMPNLGHVPMMENPALVERLIRQFVDRHSGARTEPAEA